MLRRTYIGLDIREQGLRAMAIQRRGHQLALAGAQQEAFAGQVLSAHFNQLNIHDEDGFCTTLKKTLMPLTGRDDRVSVALPDRAGQLFLVEVETPFNSRAEGVEVLRWQLKDSLPGKAQQFALDFQVMDEREPGLKKVLVAVISRAVLAQYEDLFARVGYAATVIDFHSLSLYNAYRSKIDLGQDFILIGVDGSQLSLQVFFDGVLSFCRCRTVDVDPAGVCRELNRSLVTCRSHFSGFARLPVYLHTDWDKQGELFDAVDDVFEQSVQLLISPVSKLQNGFGNHLAAERTSGMVAALGAAERMMKGGA